MIKKRELSDLNINTRVECEGTNGTIKWIGEIPNLNGIWLGVDWDDGARGKHNGSYDKIFYFQASTSTSGSFVRPTKVNLGISLEEAVRGRYQNDTTIEDDVTTQLKRSINARFVEIVGMEKIGKRQSQLCALQTVVLDGWLIYGAGDSDLATLLPNSKYLDISKTLLSSWVDISNITKQLSSLKHLNVSGNLLTLCENPSELVDSTKHITHIVLNNMLGYCWDDLMLCAKLFPNAIKVQLAYNNLEKTGLIPNGVFDYLEDIDVGANPIAEWDHICTLGGLPKLKILNLCRCKFTSVAFPDTPVNEKTPLFPSLEVLMLAHNLLNYWDSVSELEKLSRLEELTLNHDAVDGVANYFLEFTFGRLSFLRILNRTRVSIREKRDFQLFYLRTFSDAFYSSGGSSDAKEIKLTEEFVSKHPSYLSVALARGIPPDDRTSSGQKTQKLRDLKIEVTMSAPDSDDHQDFAKSFLPSTKISKVKMMIKRAMKLPGQINLKLSYISSKTAVPFEIEMTNDSQELQFYSISSRDTIVVRW